MAVAVVTLALALPLAAGVWIANAMGTRQQAHRRIERRQRAHPPRPRRPQPRPRAHWRLATCLATTAPLARRMALRIRKLALPIRIW